MKTLATTALLLSLLASAACAQTSFDGTVTSTLHEQIANEQPMPNEGGQAATFTTERHLDVTNAFHTAQGTNGRSCASCHLPQDGWSVSPGQVARWFEETDGTHPIFLPLDADHPTADVSTVEARRAAYSMLLRGLFRRGGAPPATRDFDIVAAEDPHGFGSVSPQRFSFFRRPLATANFHLAKNVGWDDANTRSGQTMPQGLFAQAANNIVSGQGGATPTNATVDAIVSYESSIAFAQSIVPGAGRLDQNGGLGGPELLAQQAFVAGRFDLYDAWANDPSPARAAIARGQELFNTKANANGRTCLGCHNAANNGSNVNGTNFDVGASGEGWASIDALPVYTVKNRLTGDEVRTTDPGKANRSGKWSDMNRFKVPSLRGLTARAPFFHNGLAKDLPAVVQFYEASLGFDFTNEEEADLAAFLNAL